MGMHVSMSAQSEMMAFWQNLGHRPDSTEELLRQRATSKVSEPPLPPERYETDEEIAATKAKRDECRVKIMAKKYMVPMDEMRRWLELAKGPCTICRRFPKDGRRHSIDHCHRSGKIRAPLCSRCNTLVGQLECYRDLIPIARAYIQRFKEAP